MNTPPATHYRHNETYTVAVSVFAAAHLLALGFTPLRIEPSRKQPGRCVWYFDGTAGPAAEKFYDSTHAARREEQDTLAAHSQPNQSRENPRHDHRSEK